MITLYWSLVWSIIRPTVLDLSISVVCLIVTSPAVEGFSVFPYRVVVGPVVKPSVSTCFVKSGLSMCVDFSASVVLINFVCLGEISWSMAIWVVAWFSCDDVTYTEVGVAVVAVDVVSGADNRTHAHLVIVIAFMAHS